MVSESWREAIAVRFSRLERTWLLKLYCHDTFVGSDEDRGVILEVGNDRVEPASRIRAVVHNVEPFEVLESTSTANIPKITAKPKRL